MCFFTCLLLTGTPINYHLQSPNTVQGSVFFPGSSYEYNGLVDPEQPISNAHTLKKKLKEYFGFKIKMVEDRNSLLALTARQARLVFSLYPSCYET